jgi:hypothetical protein
VADKYSEILANKIARFLWLCDYFVANIVFQFVPDIVKHPHFKEELLNMYECYQHKLFIDQYYNAFSIDV